MLNERGYGFLLRPPRVSVWCQVPAVGAALAAVAGGLPGGGSKRTDAEWPSVFEGRGNFDFGFVGPP